MSSKIKLIAPALLLAVLIAAGCYKDHRIVDLATTDNGTPGPTVPKPDDTTKPPPTSGEVTFSKDILPIFTGDCLESGCHGTGGHIPDLSASKAYASINNATYIDKTTPSNSMLYKRMVSTVSGYMMPPSGSNAGDAKKVLDWITAGAKNN